MQQHRAILNEAARLNDEETVSGLDLGIAAAIRHDETSLHGTLLQHLDSAQQTFERIQKGVFSEAAFVTHFCCIRYR